MRIRPFAPWTINSDECSKTEKYKDSLIQMLIGLPEDIIIPDGITKIIGNTRYFREKTSLKAIRLSETVTTIEANAFASCTGLTEIYLPASVTSIGANAFSDTTCTINCGFSADSPAAANAPWGGTGQVNFDVPSPY